MNKGQINIKKLACNAITTVIIKVMHVSFFHFDLNYYVSVLHFVSFLSNL